MAATTLPVFALSILLLLSTYTSQRPDEEDLTLRDASDEGDQGQSDPNRKLQEQVDVVLLNEGNFSDFVRRNRFVMVEFQSPWCGRCKALAPHYAAAAAELKGDVILAKVDATVDRDLSFKFDVRSYPTLYFFIDGVHAQYGGQRHKDAIVSWVKKKAGLGVVSLMKINDAERVLATHSKIVLGFFHTLAGLETEELAAASRLEDDIEFYQTSNPDVAKLFHIDPQVKRPALVMLKREGEKIQHFDGRFARSEIAEFVYAGKLPLMIIFTRESAPLVFHTSFKKQLLLFVTSSDSKKILPGFQEAAKAFKGKIQFVYVQMDKSDYTRSISDYFGATGNAPKVFGFNRNAPARKFLLYKELTLTNIKSFAEGLLEDKLKPFYKSDPIPEQNDGDVKIVVANTFDEIVLDESNDVLLEIYANWCRHCRALEPIYNNLAIHFKGVESLVIAKMDGTTNDHPRAERHGYPTLLFFPAGNKSSDPIWFKSERTFAAIYKFVKKHVSVPLEVHKPDAAKKTDAAIKTVVDKKPDEVKKPKSSETLKWVTESPPREEDFSGGKQTGARIVSVVLGAGLLLSGGMVYKKRRENVRKRRSGITARRAFS